MTATDGTVTEIDNSSGHYKPTKEHLHDALRYLADQGLNFDRAIVRVVGPNDTETKYRASAWIRNVNAPALGNRQFTLGGNR
jgi:arabinogalactan endo-1,4-beta-galactosidase